MGMDTVSRWWLFMSVVIWTVSAGFLKTTAAPNADTRLTALFLLTLAGQLGAIVATNLVIFSRV
jgi:formate hydrogenlyase subunit 3/multisubunit Na+/H+ antiporter MnhD subunit